MPDNDIPGSDPSAPPPGHAPGSFDFDAWSQLARRDPNAYFRARRQAIDALIHACPKGGANLRRLQMRIDSARACAGTPVEAARQITGLMQVQLGILRQKLEMLEREVGRFPLAGPK